MSTLVAAIPAAGWKGYIQKAMDKKEWGVKVPEALLPLPNGETILSRAVKQIRAAGAAEIFIGIGVPGKSSPIYENWLARGGYAGHTDKTAHYDVEMGAEIWTKERLEYVAGLDCQVISMPDFDTTPCFCTIACLLEAILENGISFDKLLVTFGDYVMTDETLDKILALEYPCMWMPIKWHQGWLLDVQTAAWLAAYLSTIKSIPYARWPTHREELKQGGIVTTDILFPSVKDFVEVERPGAYKLALKIAAK